MARSISKDEFNGRLPLMTDMKDMWTGKTFLFLRVCGPMQNPKTSIRYLPDCLKRSLSTILVMQFSFCRTNWLSGILWINLLKRTLVCKPQSKQMVSIFTQCDSILHLHCPAPGQVKQFCHCVDTLPASSLQVNYYGALTYFQET